MRTIDVNAANSYVEELQEWVNREQAAVELLHYTGQLLYNKGVELVLFRTHLVDASPSSALQKHEYARKVVKKSITIYDTRDIAASLSKIKDLKPSKLDVGRLAAEFMESKDLYPDIDAFVNDTLKDFIGSNHVPPKPRDVILFGFGRIGRLMARELIQQAGKGQQLRLRAIVTRKNDEKNIRKRAALLQNDSVHGRFNSNVEVDAESKCIRINGQKVAMIAASKPEEVDYAAYGIDNAIVIDNTGVFRDREGLQRHQKTNGVSRVLLTAPGKELPNIVYGINHEILDIEKDKIVSAASCTTNAIAPILKVVHDAVGIEKGHIETIHAYTNDQNLLDNMHKKARRGRSAALNMVITSTGAGKAVAKVIPDLAGKLTANAVRVPTPNGSLAILNLQLKKAVTQDEINEYVRKEAVEGSLINQIKFSVNEELVSNDIIGERCATIFDSLSTVVHPDGKSVSLYTWYDNEYGYTKQVIRLAKYITKVRRLIYY